MYNTRTLNTFQAGLLEPYRSFLAYKSPASLEDCLVLLRNHDNYKQQVKFLNFVRQRNDSKSTKHSTLQKTHYTAAPAPHFYQQPRPQICSNTSTRPYFSLPNRTPFPSGPINVFRKPPQSGNNSNSNNNRNQTNNSQQKPTPMSISTTHSARPNSNFTRRFNNENNFFKSTDPRDIIVEELFNVEDQEQYESDPYENAPDYPCEQTYYRENEEIVDENFPVDASEPSTLT